MPEAYLVELDRHIQTTEDAVTRWTSICQEEERRGADTSPLRRLLRATETTLQAMRERRKIVASAVESLRIAGMGRLPASPIDPRADATSESAEDSSSL